MYGRAVPVSAERSPLVDKWRFCFVAEDTTTQFLNNGLPDSCETVLLPHVFPGRDKNGVPLEGYGWYFKTFSVHGLSKSDELYLCFEGVSLYAEVFVNGYSAGGSTFAYMPFTINLTRFCRDTDTIHCAVRIDNRLRKNHIPDDKAKGWWVYGGIDREVYLDVLPRKRINTVAVRTFHLKKDTFDLHCSVTPVHGSKWDHIDATIVTHEGNDTLTQFSFAGTDTTIRISGVKKWTPDDPFRYRMSFTLCYRKNRGKSETLLRGFCQLTTQGDNLYLNGKEIFLRGISRHDFLALNGEPLTREQRKRDLVDLKELGVNFLRIAHFPQHRDVYELCDSLGILVMDEIPAWKTDKKYLATPEAWEYGADYMKNLIELHGNFTCIVVWSIGNQFKSYKTSVADYVKAVSLSVKKTDPSRLVTFCSYYYLWDKAFRYVDLIAINEYFGWELASVDMLPPLLDKIHIEWPEKPVVVTEVGAQSKYGLRNTDARLAGPFASMLSKDLSEDHHALFIGAHLDSIWSRKSYMRGVVVWSYADYMANLNKKRTPDMLYGINSCGMVTADRQKKLVYEVVKKKYNHYKQTFFR